MSMSVVGTYFSLKRQKTITDELTMIGCFKLYRKKRLLLRILCGVFVTNWSNKWRDETIFKVSKVQSEWFFYRQKG
jgi:hypothetical protein